MSDEEKMNRERLISSPMQELIKVSRREKNKRGEVGAICWWGYLSCKMPSKEGCRSQKFTKTLTETGQGYEFGKDYYRDRKISSFSGRA